MFGESYSEFFIKNGDRIIGPLKALAHWCSDEALSQSIGPGILGLKARYHFSPNLIYNNVIDVAPFPGEQMLSSVLSEEIPSA